MEGASAWKSVLGEIEVSVTPATFNTWFKNTYVVESDDTTLKIAVPNVFAKNQIEQKFSDQVTSLFKKKGYDYKKITYIVETSSTVKRVRKSISTDSPPINSTTENSTTIKKSRLKTNSLNQKYTFENFIVGSSNELAYTACMSVAKEPGTKYNPLFIYGGVGLGKTHLIQAIGNTVKEANPEANIIYTSSEAFVKDFVDSIRLKNDFAKNYREADILIIDDMQFIAGKEKTQEEFFHTFNTLHQLNKQVIISSDRPPKSIPTLTDRLRSRFEWGMTIDIQAPDFETRSAILQAKANENDFELPPDTVEYLANNIQSNIRELEGALNQLMAYCELRNIPPSLDNTKALLNNTSLRPKHITPKQIINAVVDFFDIEEEVLLGPKRDKDIVLPRQIAMYLLRSELHLSFPKIANSLGRKDHTTAIHSIDKIEKQMNINHIIRQNINSIKDTVYR